jgi:hypothetical protein
MQENKKSCFWQDFNHKVNMITPLGGQKRVNLPTLDFTKLACVLVAIYTRRADPAYPVLIDCHYPFGVVQ